MVNKLNDLQFQIHFRSHFLQYVKNMFYTGFKPFRVKLCFQCCVFCKFSAFTTAASFCNKTQHSKNSSAFCGWLLRQNANTKRNIPKPYLSRQNNSHLTSFPRLTNQRLKIYIYTLYEIMQSTIPYILALLQRVNDNDYYDRTNLNLDWRKNLDMFFHSSTTFQVLTFCSHRAKMTGVTINTYRKFKNPNRKETMQKIMLYFWPSNLVVKISVIF